MAKKKEFNGFKYLEIAAAKGEEAAARPILSVGYNDFEAGISVSSDGYRLHMVKQTIGDSRFIEFKKSYDILPNASYLDYSSLIADYSADLEFSANAGDIMRAVKRCRIFNNVIYVKPASTIDNAALVFYAKDDELGDCSSLIDESMGASIRIYNNGVDFCVNGKFLLDAVSCLNENEWVKIKTSRGNRVMIEHAYGMAVIMPAKHPIYKGAFWLNADALLEQQGGTKHKALETVVKATRRPKSKKPLKDVRLAAREKSSKNLIVTETIVKNDNGTVTERTEYRRPASDFEQIKHGKTHSEIIASSEFAAHWGYNYHTPKHLPFRYNAKHLLTFDMPERAKNPVGFFMETAKNLIDNGAKVYTDNNVLAVRVGKKSAWSLRWSYSFIYCYFETAGSTSKMVAVKKYEYGAERYFDIARRDLESMLSSIPVASMQVSAVNANAN